MARAGLGNRLAMWRALRAAPARGFVSQPEPRSIGLFARGRQLLAGNVLLAGHLAEAPGTPIWDLGADVPGFAAEAHGFAWLDDLAAVGDTAARSRAQDWVWDWIARFGPGRGPGWHPDLTGRRLIRWINNAPFLLMGRDKAAADAFFHQLTAQTLFLSRRWQQAAPGIARIEALTGLLVASLALTGMERLVPPAIAALADHCGREIDAEGGIPTRCPEELLEVFVLLTWAERALSETGRLPPATLIAALERMAPALRLLRHADGGLARFQGGG
ncbi:MAG: heparinase, partial [Rhodobacteraceae bacterium]|nr:heparinase [Paracoccaceae bacterium]